GGPHSEEPAMIELYYWPTPNGHKVTLLLEELAEAGAPLEYRIVPVDIGKGAQFEPGFLRISPNNKMPAIVDHAPEGGGEPLSVFESGAILEYLADKTGRFLPRDLRGRWETLQWLYWQVGGLGPMTGQHGHFNVYAPEKVPYAIERYGREAERLLGVLDKRLAGRAFIAGDDYSIADMACYPWINPYDKAPLDLGRLAARRRPGAAGHPGRRQAEVARGEEDPVRAGRPLARRLRRRGAARGGAIRAAAGAAAPPRGGRPRSRAGCARVPARARWRSCGAARCGCRRRWPPAPWPVRRPSTRPAAVRAGTAATRRRPRPGRCRSPRRRCRRPAD